MNALALCATLLLLSGALASELVTSPLILWSNQDGVVGHGTGSQVVYNVLSDAHDATAKAVLGLLGKGEYSTDLVNLNNVASSQGMSIVIFAGSQLGSADLRQGKAAKLSAVLDSAASSLVLPFSSSQSLHTARSVQSSLEEAGLVVKTVGCGQQPVGDLATDVSSALSETGSQVVVVCPSVEPSISGTQAGLEAELDQLLAVQEAIDAAELKHVFVYISQGKQQGQQQRRRALQQASAPPPAAAARVVPEPLKGFRSYKTCGALCQTQVRWLEALLSVLFMALACCAGLSCLSVLNTPTRFEVPTE